MDAPELKPLTVSTSTARKLLDVGNTKYWELVKRGDIETVKIGGRCMAVYASLEALTRPAAAV